MLNSLNTKFNINTCMINKRIMFILILLIVAIGALSHVSAVDVNGTQQVAMDDNVEVTQSNDLYSSGNDAALEIDPSKESIPATQPNATITPINLEGGYKAGVATVKLTDSNNNPLSDEDIKLFVVDKVSWSTSKKTDGNGIASFEFKDLRHAELVDGGLSQYDLTVGNWPVRFELIGGDYIANAVKDNMKVLKTTANININDMTADFGEDKDFEMTLTDSVTGKPIKGEVFKIQITSDSQTMTYNQVSDENGQSKISVIQLIPGTYPVRVGLEDSSNIAASQKSARITINKIPVKLETSKLTTTYNSGENFTVRVVKDNMAFAGVKLKLKVYTGSGTEILYPVTNENGTVFLSSLGLSKGTHKVIVSNADSMFSADPVTSSIVINPKKLTIVGACKKLKNAGQITLKVKDKSTGKYVSGVKMQVKVFTGKKYKTFNLVTKKSKLINNAVGVLLKTNKFSTGTHKVTVKITSPNYKGSGTFKIVIPKTAQKYKKVTYIVSNGKGKYV